MNQTSVIVSAFAAIALGSSAHAAFIIGSITMSSNSGGGVTLQDSLGIATTSISNATGVQSWLFPKVDSTSDSFSTVPITQAVSFPQTWVFDPSSLVSPLWTIVGSDNFAFHLSSAEVLLKDDDFLIIEGTGTLTGNGYEETPADWIFVAQGAPTAGGFTWTSTTTAVPEPATPALLGAALAGTCLLRRRKPARISPSPQNYNHETNITPPDVRDRLVGDHLDNPS
jgi:PEP-CTERM motif